VELHAEINKNTTQDVLLPRHKGQDIRRHWRSSFRLCFDRFIYRSKLCRGPDP